ncbi:hypothetical protein K7X08_032372 [Anisodus acutangulus]|uniref:Uncharacterized protein n=1 Tax=Anisodus acutangulus TaxID=402998 RepID=A0A9Q1R9S5_9SOLA|nr:hypothetical protein K7X08_032372 [Anisodus acutangulus]
MTSSLKHMADTEIVLKRQRRKRDEVEASNSVGRSSRRSKGMPPELSDGLIDKIKAKEILSKKSYEEYLSYDGMVRTIKSLTRNECPMRLSQHDDVDLERLELKLNPKGRTQVAKGAISDVKFLPTVDKRVIIVGDELGYLGLWNLEETNGIYLYRPHQSKLSAITIEPFSMLKVTLFLLFYFFKFPAN